MSLGVVVKGPEGLVLAADSRITLEAARSGGPPVLINFDNATKLLRFSGGNTHVAAVTYGAAVIGLRTAHSFMPEFETSLPTGRLAVQDFSQRLSDFFVGQWRAAMPVDYKGPPSSPMTFIVGGFNEGEPYGRVFLFGIPNNPTPAEQNSNDFGVTWGGQLEIATRVISGYDPALIDIAQRTLQLNQPQVERLREAVRPLNLPIPYKVLPLQDCVDLAIFLLRTTMSAQKLLIGVRGVGGAVDVVTITRTEGVRAVQFKQVVGEGGGQKWQS